MRPFQVQQIDHVELFVPDRHEAASWYERVLGLTIVAEYERWADDPRGPLMISPDGGNTKLALFSGTSESAQRGGYDLVAFRVDGPGFLSFLARLSELRLSDTDGDRVTPDSARDHRGAYSLYFVDPWGHPLELTTYEYNYVGTQLGNSTQAPTESG